MTQPPSFNDGNANRKKRAAGVPVRSRRELPIFTKALIAIGACALLVGSYAIFVWIPNENQRLLEHDLKVFALLYHEYNAEYDRAPSRLDDLESFAREHAVGINSSDMYDAPRAFEMIRKGRFVVIWDAVLLSNGDENDKYVLGYESSASEDGRLVMLAGGSLRYVTGEEFEALPRIKTRSD